MALVMIARMLMTALRARAAGARRIAPAYRRPGAHADARHAMRKIRARCRAFRLDAEHLMRFEIAIYFRALRAPFCRACSCEF